MRAPLPGAEHAAFSKKAPRCGGRASPTNGGEPDRTTRGPGGDAGCCPYCHTATVLRSSPSGTANRPRLEPEFSPTHKGSFPAAEVERTAPVRGRRAARTAGGSGRANIESLSETGPDSSLVFEHVSTRFSSGHTKQSLLLKLSSVRFIFSLFHSFLPPSESWASGAARFGSGGGLVRDVAPVTRRFASIASSELAPSVSRITGSSPHSRPTELLR